MSWWRTLKLRKKAINMNTYMQTQAKSMVMAKFAVRHNIGNIAYFVEEIFHKKLEHFKKERHRVLRKGIPLSENLLKIN